MLYDDGVTVPGKHSPKNLENWASGTFENDNLGKLQHFMQMCGSFLAFMISERLGLHGVLPRR